MADKITQNLVPKIKCRKETLTGPDFILQCLSNDPKSGSSYCLPQFQCKWYIYTQSMLHIDKQRKYCMHNSPFGTYGNVCTSCDWNHFTTLCFFLITSFRLFTDTRHIYLSLCSSSKQLKLCNKFSLMKKQLPLTCKYIFYKHAPEVTTLQKQKLQSRRQDQKIKIKQIKIKSNLFSDNTKCPPVEKSHIGQSAEKQWQRSK